jgi:hypothetical protein
VRAGDGSPGSREAEGEGGEGFYIARSGRRPDLLVLLGGGWFLKTKSSFSASAKSGLFWLLLVLFLIVFFFLEVTKVLYSRQSRSQRGSRGKQRVVCYDGLECISSVCSYLP